MSLSSSLYTSTSGLGNTSEALQVVSNNIANINTMAYKKGSTTFADTLYQSIGTQSGSAQVGLGMSVNNVSQDFSVGSVETTTNSTDLVINGDGFFIVSQAGSEETYYTRAGNFSFDERGALATPSGYILQGWEVDPKTGDKVGAVTDLILTAFTSSPEKTEEMIVITNLNSGKDSNTETLSNVYGYDADDEDSSSVSSDTYEYPTVVTVYDSLGSEHELTIYYDKKSDTTWEYVIVCDGAEDARKLLKGTTAQGLLARGTIEFSESSGKIVNMTMEELSGRVGNVGTKGANEVDDINFEIKDSDAMLVDGYGISMTFDGNDWVLGTAGLPENYKNATVLYSDDQEIQIVLDPSSSGGDQEADLVISLDEMAMAGDTLSFDINDATDLHVQKLETIRCSNEAYGKTETTVNAASVMTTSVEDVSIVWNPYTETWQWSNPKDAAASGTLVKGVNTNASSAVNITASAIDIANAGGLTMNLEDMDLRYNAILGSWDWNEALRDDDISDVTTSLAEDNEVTMKIVASGDEGAVATTSINGIVLEWDGANWAVIDDGGLNVNIVSSSDTGVEISVYDTDPAGASTIQYTFDSALTTASGQTLSFDIDPSPPAEYGNAEIVATADNSVAIDFDADGTTDLTINVTSGATTALAGGETLSFDVDCDVPPAEYANATLTGDDTRAIIDLDGSGRDGDDDDIVFTFENALSGGEDTDPLNDRSVITFNIEGSTAWREVTSDEAKETGYFQFTTDFLGGEDGSTEMDISFNIGSKWDGNNWVNSSLSTTQWGRGSSTTYQDADGYPPGDLTGVQVASDGTVYGTYSNSQTIALFKVALADFNNANGLKSEGGNLYSETTDSGSAITNAAGENGLGELTSYSLEMSNVDISDEFVSMIELQNAYEADAKTITTVDEMMDTVISMKR